MDIYTKDKRSKIMASIKSRNTGPELLVRSLIHRLGYRFRLHSKKLPGAPDIILPRHKKVIFINGCFWHGHKGCNRSTLPSTNREFWREKITRNKIRDANAKRSITKMGWRYLTLWQCSLKNTERIEEKVKKFING